MSPTKITEKDYPSIILKQITEDPSLPRTDPTTSLWQVPGHHAVANAQSSVLPQRVDYAIIGSGVAACGAAKSILSSSASGSKSVAVFEARGLCSGATGRNGGQLTRLPPTRHTFMAENFGMAQANKIMRYTVKGLQEMHNLAESQGPELLKFSKFTKTQKFFAYYDEQSWIETQEAIELYEQEMPEDKGVYELVSKEETASVYNLNGAYGGLRFPAGVCAPYNLVTGTFSILLQKHQGRFTIQTNTPITAITHQKEDNAAHPYLLRTPRGYVRAATVIHCTNGHAAHLLPGLRGKMYPRRGTMSVQSPGPNFPKMSDKQSWSFYFTPAHDKTTNAVETGRYYGFQSGETGDLWIGGDRDSIDGFISADDTEIDKFAEANLRKMVPRLFTKNWVTEKPEVRGIWTGIMCYTGDQLPFVGKLPNIATGRSGTGEWVAAGWNTYGMTNGLLTGTALGKMVLGEDVSDWFPEAYLITEERLKGAKFKPQAVLADYFERIGAHDYSVSKSKL